MATLAPLTGPTPAIMAIRTSQRRLELVPRQLLSHSAYPVPAVGESLALGQVTQQIRKLNGIKYVRREPAGKLHVSYWIRLKRLESGTE